MLAGIDISELGPNRLVVKAGSVLETYFSFTVVLTEEDGGTRGRAYCDPGPSSITRWSGNAMKMAYGVEAVMVDASATVNGWRL